MMVSGTVRAALMRLNQTRQVSSNSVYVAQVVRFACHFGKSPDLLGPPEIRIYRALMKGGRFAADSTLEGDGFEPSVPRGKGGLPFC